MTNKFNLGTILFVVFLVLKLTNTVDWSWWWITAPIWIPFTFLFIIFITCIFVLGTTETIDIFKKGVGDGIKDK